VDFVDLRGPGCVGIEAQSLMRVTYFGTDVGPFEVRFARVGGLRRVVEYWLCREP
jgi:hypothetical protein